MRAWKQNVTKSVVALAAVALVGSWSAMPARAVEKSAADAGTIKGTVMKEGKAVGNVRVRLIKAADVQERKNPAAGKLAEGDKPRPPKPSGDKPAGGKPKGERPVPVAEATSDATTGAFVMGNVAAGDYVVQAGGQGVAGREKVTITAGGTATVTINLKERKSQPAK